MKNKEKSNCCDVIAAIIKEESGIDFLEINSNIFEIGIDSVSTINIFLRIEEMLNVDLISSDLEIDDFSSIKKICDFIGCNI